MGAHAIVIGGSMAGLLTARVLSDHFDRVTLVERDQMKDVVEVRKGQPHARHLHALLGRGLETMTRYFPDLPQALQEGGAVIDDVAENMRWYCYGDYRVRFRSGIMSALMSRPFLEWHTRRRVTALPNLTALDASAVEQLLMTDDRTRVTGVSIVRRAKDNERETLSADLVVDASGRGSSSPAWLDAFGYTRPKESVVKVDVGYATRVYRRDPDAPGSREWLFATPEAPREKCAGGAFPVEGERWIVTLAAMAGQDHPSADEQGFLEFAQSLPAPDLFNLISQAEPLSDIALHKFPASRRRHYEKLTRFPEGYLIVGDAICSFNPVYGQGMTVAAMEAAALDQLLRERCGHDGLHGMATPFFRRVAKVIDVPWRLAVGEDFRFPETQGEKAPGTDLINAYVSRVHRATHRDPAVCLAFLKVINLMQPPTSLFKPSIVLRVLRSNGVNGRGTARSRENSASQVHAAGRDSG